MALRAAAFAPFLPWVGVVALRLLTAFAPAEPILFGVPFGLLLELGVVVAATASLWIALRAALPGARA